MPDRESTHGQQEAGGTRLATTLRMANSTFAPLSLPSYRIVWLGNFFLFFSYFIALTAQSVVAFDLTGNNGAVGFVMLGQGIALLTLFPLCGAIADRFSKRKLMLLAQGGTCIVSLIIGLLISIDQISIILLAVSTFINGAMFTINAPTRSAMIGEVVPQERIGGAVALIQVGGNVGAVLGPPVAGVLLSIAFIGSSGAYYVSAAIFFIGFITLLGLPERPATLADKRWTGVLDDIGEGFRYIRASRRLSHLLVSLQFVLILGLSYIVLIPGFAKDVLDTGNGGLGILLGSAAAGGFVMSLVVASLADSRHASTFMNVCSLTASVGLILSGLAPSLAVAAVTLFIVSAGVSGYQTLSNSVALLMSDRVYFGRIFGVIFMAAGMRGVSSPVVGLLADEFGERSVLIGAGVVLCAVVFLISLTRPRLAANAERS